MLPNPVQKMMTYAKKEDATVNGALLLWARLGRYHTLLALITLILGLAAYFSEEVFMASDAVAKLILFSLLTALLVFSVSVLYFIISEIFYFADIRNVFPKKFAAGPIFSTFPIPLFYFFNPQRPALAWLLAGASLLELAMLLLAATFRDLNPAASYSFGAAFGVILVVDIFALLIWLFWLGWFVAKPQQQE